ncbi:MAG: ArsR family transcriptional regulator [Nanohaloarchaea archaeon]|nr:ArsR family transcriptional regulator [Candidatus Nanohaloarchaea archaeon]
MELDFNAVKALSSPTRIRILNSVMEKDATPTSISNEIGKSKSTVSSHLTKLHEAELVEKDEKDGRKRVVYKPTRKAETIVNGKERKVKFSLTGSAISGIAALGIGTYSFTQLGKQKAQEEAASAMTTMNQMGAMDTAEKAQKASESGLVSADLFLFLALGLFGISMVSFVYGYTMRKLGE